LGIADPILALVTGYEFNGQYMDKSVAAENLYIAGVLVLPSLIPFAGQAIVSFEAGRLAAQVGESAIIEAGEQGLIDIGENAFETTGRDFLGGVFNPGDLMPNGNLAGVGPGSMYMYEPAAEGDGGFIVTRTPDGGITITHPDNPDAFMSGQVSEGNLQINMAYVPAQMRGQGIYGQLYQEMLNQAGEVNSISGQMEFANKMAITDALDQGYSLQEAAEMTPAAKVRSSFGFTDHTYDPETGILTSTKP